MFEVFHAAAAGYDAARAAAMENVLARWNARPQTVEVQSWFESQFKNL